MKRPSQRSWRPSPTSMANVSTSSRGTIVRLDRRPRTAVSSARPSGGRLAPVGGVGVVVVEPGQAGGAVGVGRGRRLAARLVGQRRRRPSWSVVVVVTGRVPGLAGGHERRRPARGRRPTPAGDGPASASAVAVAGPARRTHGCRRGRPASAAADGRRSGRGSSIGLQAVSQVGRQRPRDRLHLALRGPDHQQVGRAPCRRGPRRWRRRAGWRRGRTRRRPARRPRRGPARAP